MPSDIDDLYALSVLGNALGGGMSSRLFQRIREELGLAYSVYTYSSSYQGLGSFCVYAGTRRTTRPRCSASCKASWTFFCGTA